MMMNERVEWSLSVVYGPQGDAEKIAFIDELKLLGPSMRTEWVLLGDFNLITKAADKSNSNINRRMIGKFTTALHALQLREIELSGRKYTWTNDQAIPTMSKIDHVFVSDDWDMLFPDVHLRLFL